MIVWRQPILSAMIPQGISSRIKSTRADAFDQSDLKDGKPVCLPVQSGNRAVENHTLQEGNGVHNP